MAGGITLWGKRKERKKERKKEGGKKIKYEE